MPIIVPTLSVLADCVAAVDVVDDVVPLAAIGPDVVIVASLINKLAEHDA